MINIIKDGIKNEIKNLSSILENIHITKLKPITINVAKESVLNLDLQAKKSFIYVIKSRKPIKKQGIIDSIKSKKQDFAMCRINDNFNENKENCLYVGSSHNIVKRLCEHLGFGGSAKTYAMHLKEWWNVGDVVIELYKIEDSDKCLQLYEDLLWDYYKPILGRQGKK